jgi:hypothetical protein
MGFFDTTFSLASLFGVQSETPFPAAIDLNISSKLP